MATPSARVSWFGLILIIFGLVLLLDKLNVINIAFSTVFWPVMTLVGLVTAASGYSRNRRGKIFGGTILFLYSLYFFLRSQDFIEFRGHLFLPATFFIIGVGFLMMYLQNFRDWYLLIPALIFAGVGAAFILAEFGYLYWWDVSMALADYWPVILIVIGLAILLKRRGRLRKEASLPQSPGSGEESPPQPL